MLANAPARLYETLISPLIWGGSLLADPVPFIHDFVPVIIVVLQVWFKILFTLFLCFFVFLFFFDYRQ